MRDRMRKYSVTISFLVLLFLVSSTFFLKSGLAQISTQRDITYPIHGSGRCIIQTKEGGYALAGNADDQFLFLKVDFSGHIQWQKTYGEGTAYSIIETGEGGYALAGTGTSFNLVKTDSLGNLQWKKHYSKTDVPFHSHSLIQTSDGGYALTGWISYNSNSPQWDWTIKTDTNGNIQWNKTYGIRSGISHGHKILEEDNGEYILAANGNISKLDSKGNIKWTKPCTVANSLIKTEDEGYLATAGTGAALVKSDGDGNIQWHKIYQFQGARWSFFHSLSKCSVEGYVIAGVTYPVYDGLAWIVKVNNQGHVEGEITFPPESGINNRAFSIIESNDGEYVFTGTKNANNGEGNIWFSKIGLSAIPEFSLWVILPLFLITTASVMVLKKTLISHVKLYIVGVFGGD